MATEFDIDSLLDSTLDDLEDLPEFKVYPAGTHRCIMKLEKKVIGEGEKAFPAIEAKLSYISPEELADPAEEAPKAGDESNSVYNLTNPYGQGNLKKLLGGFAEQVGSTKLADIVAHFAEGVEVVVTTKIRKNKEKTQSYLDIVSAEIA